VFFAQLIRGTLNAMNDDAANLKPILFFLLAEDGIFELMEIWSVLHRQSVGFDLVLLDQTGGKTKLPPPIRKAALKTVAVGPEGLGGIINAISAEMKNDLLVFTSDRVFPTHDHWIQRLCEPILSGRAVAVFGRVIPAPGGNYFLNNDIEKSFPPNPSKVDVSGFSMDNCAVKGGLLLQKPFPEGALRDPAAVWRASNGIAAEYCPSAIVQRYTLLTIGGIYRESRSKGEDMSVVRDGPSLFAVFGEIVGGIWRDVVFALSIKKPQYLWFPFLYRFAVHFGYYLGTRKK